MQITVTIADTHFHAVSIEAREGDGGRNVQVIATDLRTGAMHLDRWTEGEVSLVVAVCMAGEDFDLPHSMYTKAAKLVSGWPVEVRPIP